MRALALLLLTGVAAAGQPRLFLGPSDLARINELGSNGPKWAQDARGAIVQAARDWPQSYIARYGLKELALPPDGGQWTLWYVCPVHGVSLNYTAPNTHTCPVDKKVWSGWPYDQVIYSRRHSDLAAAARDLALAYQFTGERSYAEGAAWILKQYAAKYLTYPLKDVNNKVTASAARASAQTLDESVWLIPLAWAYDLLSGSDVLTDAERADIETRLLRAAVGVIQRYDAGTSNWQSWHNAAIGSVGFTLQDAGLIDAAVKGKSGFQFQMRNSILGEGFWFEGAWGYHFYALDPLVQLADMAAQNGVDLWSDPGLRGMFVVPLQLTFADGSLPAFNDSKPQSLFDQSRLYEHAYARLGEPLVGAIARQRTRGRDALLFGSPDLPEATLDQQKAGVFPEAGFAVLRAPGNDHTLTMKFGPHGGGHGHYDKLGFVSYFNGGILGVDPGTQSYAAPTHANWDKETVAHNAVVVDEKTQAAATGRLVWQDFNDRYSAARAEAGAVYPNMTMSRSVLVTNEYAVELFQAASTDGSSRQMDWVYHNDGKVSASVDLAAYAGFGKANGYQNLTSNRAGATADSWTAVFDGKSRAPTTVSSVYASTSAVSGKFEYSTEQAAGGLFSGKMSYDFRGDGYLLFSVNVAKALPDAAPSGVRVMIYGDGSGHKLTLRLNDATDERFTVTVGPVNWTGWKQVEIRDAAWSHYLGNNDGVIDLPVKSVSLELGRMAGGVQAGALYVDDFALLYGDAEPAVVADFELKVRSVRVWMVGGADTTVVTGNGLGPDLLQAVPYLMARRSGASTEFATLLEPFVGQAGIVDFSRSADGGFVVKGAGFEDRFRFGEGGVVGFERK